MRYVEPVRLEAEDNWIIIAPRECGELTFVWKYGSELLEITYIGIKDACIRRGYGRMLINSCELFARERGLKRITVLATPIFSTLSYYIRMRYVPVTDRDKKVVHEVLMLRTEDGRLYDTVRLEKYL